MRRTALVTALVVSSLLGCTTRRGGHAMQPPPPRLAELDEIARLEDARDTESGRLSRLLRHPETEVRARAALALGHVGDPSARPLLRHALSDTQPAVRDQAAFALGLLEDRDAEPALLKRLVLEDSQPSRTVVLEALGRAGSERSLPALTVSLTEPEGEVRTAAALALARLGARRRLYGASRKAEIALAGALGDRHPEVRLAAAYALRRLAHTQPSRPPKDDPVLSALKAALRDQSPEVRAQALRACAARAPRDREPLVAALADSDWRVRVQAVRALPPTGDAGVDAVATFASSSWQHLVPSHELVKGPDIHPVLAALQELTPHAQRTSVLAAAEAIYRAAAPTPGLRPLAAHGRALVQCAAATLLERGGAPYKPDTQPQARQDGASPPAAEAGWIARCGTSNDPPTWRRRALTALAQGVSRSPHETDTPNSERSHVERARRLEELFRDTDPRVRAAVMEAAGSLDALRAARLLREGLASDDPGVVAAAARAVRRAADSGRRRDAAAVPRLCRALGRLRSADNPQALVSVIDALKTLSDNRAIEALAPLLGDPNVTVRSHVRGALRWLYRRDPVMPPPAHPQPSPGDPWALRGRRVEAVLVTARGRLVVRLFPDDAPRAVASFVALARRGFYRGLRFHRVVPDFVVQGGDPRGDGFGGPGYTLRCEVNHRRFVRGTVGMAITGKDTGGSQFFITHSPQPHLDGHHTAMGQLQSGHQVLDALQADDQIEDVTIEVK